MLPLAASKLLIVEGVEADERMCDRARRLRSGIAADDTRTVDDTQLAAIVRQELSQSPHNGMQADFKPIAILNRFRFDDDEAERRRRIEAYPELNRLKFNGYGGFDWRDSGSVAWRAGTGLVCQPAWQLHTIVGCHFRCAYCHLSRVLNVMMNFEEFVARLDGWIAQCPRQTLFQYDNWTDAVCFEPEYGGAKLLVDYFARQPGRALELYVGKSDHVDWMLDYDHRGHTVCCWSVSAATQSRRFEYRSAPMEDRIEAMRKCQQAGYAVRVRFSPIIPVRNWEAENREMIRLLFSKVRPDVVTFETIRFLTHDAMAKCFDLSLLDEDFVAAMKGFAGQPFAQGCEVPDEWRKRVYRFFFDELEAVGCEAPVAFCREKRELWDHFAADFARYGQHPDAYICNCGPYAAPATAALIEA